jgi:intracellular multiplication protein IcmP
MAGGQAKGDDVEITLALLVAIGFLFMWALWSYAKQPIVEGIRWVKWAEVSVFQVIDPSLAEDKRLLENLRNDQAAVKQASDTMDRQKRRYTVDGWIANGLLAPEVLWQVSNRVGEYVKIPIAIILLGAGIFYMFFSYRTKFRTAYTLEGLIKLQSRQWPVITPIVDFNPIKDSARNPGEAVPARLPPFAEALSPEEWVAYNRIPVNNKVPDKDAIRRAFQVQLGPRWTGIGCLTPAQRCLFAGFALKGAQKRKDSDTLLGKVALLWNHKSDFTADSEVMAEVDKIIRDPKFGGEALKIANRFAYRTTALIGVLKWARERGGVLAPASFLWLRGHDRALWYPLNNFGRRAFHAEAAGAMAHYMAEKNAGKPLPIPRLETAILTLTQYWGINMPKLPDVDEG